MEKPKERYRNWKLCRTRIGKCATLGVQFHLLLQTLYVITWKWIMIMKLWETKS